MPPLPPALLTAARRSPYPRLLIAASLLALAGCADGVSPPQLLSVDQIAAATQGSTALPDNAVLLARAARLTARAQAMRRTSVAQLERTRIEDRARRLGQS